MQRLRLRDLRLTRLYSLLGLCQGNMPGIADIVNAAQQQLLYDPAASDESWWGTWAEVAFNVSISAPYITLPRHIARLESVVICNQPVALSNQFFEYLRFGNGRMSQDRCDCNNQLTAAYTRNNAVTFTDLSSAPQYLRMYITDARDVSKRVLLQGTDANGKVIYSTDNTLEVTGIFVNLETPFATSTLTFESISGIQKDITYGQVEFYQVDPTTGDESLLLTMEPSEETASYRRYYFDKLPCGCCVDSSSNEDSNVQVNAIAKLEFIPVQVDTDYCLLQNAEAIIEGCQMVHYMTSDTPSAKSFGELHRRRAIKLLNGELGHYEGVNVPSIQFKPFGSAELARAGVGMI